MRRLLLFLVLLLAFFRGALGRSTRLLRCLRGHALGRGWLVVVLLLEYCPLPLLLLPLLPLLLLLLEGALALLLLPLLELLLGLLLLTLLTVTAGFFLQSPPFSLRLHP